MDILAWIASVAVVAALYWATRTGQRLVVLLPVVAAGAVVILGGTYLGLGGPAWFSVTTIAWMLVNVLPRPADRDRGKAGPGPTG